MYTFCGLIHIGGKYEQICGLNHVHIFWTKNMNTFYVPHIHINVKYVHILLCSYSYKWTVCTHFMVFHSYKWTICTHFMVFHSYKWTICTHFMVYSFTEMDNMYTFHGLFIHRNGLYVNVENLSLFAISYE